MKNVFIWIVRFIAAGILLQTLFFKFTGSAESVYIFSKLGMEPYGRIGSGIGELIAAILILIPRTTLLGALIALGIITGAIASHLLVLGIEVMNDGGLLFLLALTTFACCVFLIIKNWKKLPDLLKLKI